MRDNKENPSKNYPHSYYPCVIGCGKDKFTPDTYHYYTPNQRDNQDKAQQPIEIYYQKNFEVVRPNGKKEMTINTGLLPNTQSIMNYTDSKGAK